MTPLTERQRLLLAYGITQTASLIETLTASGERSLSSIADELRYEHRDLLYMWAEDQLRGGRKAWTLDAAYTREHARQYLTERVVQLEALLAEIKEGGNGASGTRLAGGPQSDAAQAGGVVPAG